MRFSVIIPLYNKENYIAEAIQSVLAQTLQDFELIVVDDGSTDNSLDAARKFESGKLKVLSKTNGGTATARNMGIKNATADLLCFLDADDIWLPDFLENIAELTEAFPQAGMYGTAYRFLRKKKTYHPGFYGLEENEKMILVSDYFTSILMGEQVITASSVCIPNTVFQKVGIFNEKVRHTEDQEMWNRIAMKYPIAFNTTVSAIYRQDSTNMKTKRVPKHEIEYAACLQQMLDKREIPVRYISKVKKLIAANLIGVASLNLLAGDKETARKFLNDPRTNNFPERKASWENMMNLPSGLVKIAYAIRNSIKKRR